MKSTTLDSIVQNTHSDGYVLSLDRCTSTSIFYDVMAKSRIVPIDNIDSVKVYLQNEIPYILGFPITTPFTGPLELDRINPELVRIIHEIKLCQSGYKKIEKGSSMDFDGGYKFAKLWFDSYEEVTKVTFLTPTQAEFDKDECPVFIHPYGWFDRKVHINDPFIKDEDIFGIYSENDELRIVIPETAYPKPNVFTFDLVRDIRKDECEILGKEYPLFNSLRIQKNYRGFFKLYLNGKELYSPGVIYPAYLEMKKKEKEGWKPPYLFEVYYTKDNKISFIKLITD